MSFVVTSGNSMEPMFHTGDLVIVRRAGTYHVGDVVAYHSAELHTVVIHRIAGLDGDRYIFRGDNNDFFDNYHPSRGELIGRQALLIPQGGSVLQRLLTPKIMAVAAGLLALLFYWENWGRAEEDEEEEEQEAVGDASREAVS